MKFFFLINLCLLITLSSQAQLISDGLQAYYKFDNSLQDATSNGNDLINLSTNLSYGSIYQSDYSVSFNNSNGTTAAFNSTNYSAYAFSFWIKTSQIKSENQTILQGAYIGFGIHIEANTGKIGGFFNGTSTGAYSSSVVVTDNEWHHIVFQCDGNMMYVYIDNALDGSLSSTMLTGNNSIFIGNSNQGNKSYDGELNEFRIYDRMLSVCEIKELNRQKEATVNASNGISVNANDLVVKDDACITNSEQIQASVIHFKAYPNPPLDDNLIVEFENIEMVKLITITNSIGQIVKQKIPNDFPRVELNLSGLSSGLYFLTIHGVEGQLETAQIVKP